MQIESLLVHGAVDGDVNTGAVNVPIYQTSTYKQEGLGNYKYEYSRTGNPTREALEKTIGALEGGYNGLAFASGMAALTAVLSLFKAGDRIILPDNLYGGTFRVVDKVFTRFDLRYTIVEPDDTEALKKELEKGDVVAVFIETPTNPLMDITDLEEVSSIAKNYGALVVVDNTFMSPYLQRPIEHGADIVVHSATKYIGGHSNTVAGLVVPKTRELWDRLQFIQNSTGGVLGPFDSFLLLTGLKTLAVRMDRHNENAKAVFDYLQKEPAVSKIYYTGDPLSKGYEVHNKQASGYGGMISFVVAEGYDHKVFVESLKLITLGESLGGVESLICHPATMTHAAIPAEIREKVGIVDTLLRLSVGIEKAEDLIEDLSMAFRKAKK
ncbi:MAG: PLP-dependent aspartate aminotransferase family protein [Lachnospiraceae bacterium]|nr:PLP-dependent aspartate aminotransferase family protein [Lachnospiraceae bacterium]